MTEKVKNKCSVCGKRCQLYFKNMEDYVYKIKVKGRTLVQCSYTCWRIEQGRNDNGKRNYLRNL